MAYTLPSIPLPHTVLPVQVWWVAFDIEAVERRFKERQETIMSIVFEVGPGVQQLAVHAVLDAVPAGVWQVLPELSAALAYV